jgi:ElaA protein
MVALRWGGSELDLDAAIALRREVFCVEQGVPVEEEVDGRDDEALHLLAFDGPVLVGTLRLLFETGVVKIGRVAVVSSRRGEGIATLMLDEALLEASRRGARRARLASQLAVVELYERAGFTVESPIFEEAGIPHVWMSRLLGAG